MSKESWFVGLGQEEVAWVWGKCLKYLKSGWNRKGRRRNRFLKRAGHKLDLGLGSLGKGGLYVVHASCFSSLQGGRYSGLLGRGENLIWGGGLCCLLLTEHIAACKNWLDFNIWKPYQHSNKCRKHKKGLPSILLNGKNTKKNSVLKKMWFHYMIKIKFKKILLLK